MDGKGLSGMVRAMAERPIDEEAAEQECATTPFDEYSRKKGAAGRRGLHLAGMAATLRVLSAVALAFAACTAALILALDAAHLIQRGTSWRVKSALPLIGIGVSYALLQFTVPRSRTEFCLSLAVSAAFILWGAEQFIRTPAIVPLVDDCVVFLFVLDLGIVIRGQLGRGMGKGSAD